MIMSRQTIENEAVPKRNESKREKVAVLSELCRSYLKIKLKGNLILWENHDLAFYCFVPISHFILSLVSFFPAYFLLPKTIYAKSEIV